MFRLIEYEVKLIKHPTLYIHIFRIGLLAIWICTQYIHHIHYLYI